MLIPETINGGPQRTNSAAREARSSKPRSHNCGYTATVDTLPLRKAKDKLSALIDRVEGTHERVTITRNGQAAAVLISPDDLAALDETLDVLSDRATMARLSESRAEFDRGEGMDETQLRALLSRRDH